MDKIIYVTFSQVAVAFLFIGINNKRIIHSRYIRYFLFIGLCHLILKLFLLEFSQDQFLAYRFFIPFSFGYTPALFLFIYEVYHNSFLSKRIQFAHFIPLVFSTLFYIIGIFYYSRFGIHPLMNFYVVNGYYLLGLQIILYAALSIRLSLQGLRKDSEATYIFRYSLVISILFMVLGIMILIDRISPSLIGYQLAVLIAYPSLCVIFILILHMQFSKRLVQIVEDVGQSSLEEELKSKYRSSGLNEEDKNQILASIEHHFTSQKPYLNTSYKLEHLAKQLDIPKHHISQVLNELTGKNFFQFVNAWRVEEVCKKLNESREDHLNLTDIAYICGFNSKSSFNHNFKKITGKTPTEYLRREVEQKEVG